MNEKRIEQRFRPDRSGLLVKRWVRSGRSRKLTGDIVQSKKIIRTFGTNLHSRVHTALLDQVGNLFTRKSPHFIALPPQVEFIKASPSIVALNSAWRLVTNGSLLEHDDNFDPQERTNFVPTLLQLTFHQRFLLTFGVIWKMARLHSMRRKRQDKKSCVEPPGVISDFGQQSKIDNGSFFRYLKDHEKNVSHIFDFGNFSTLRIRY